MVVSRGHPWIVVWNDADLPHGCCRSSAQTDTDLLCGFGLKLAETRRRTSCATTLNEVETRRKDHSNYQCRNRTYLDMKYE